jgi:hypothetical protein
MGFILFLSMGGIVGPVTKVTPAAKEKDLDTSVPTSLMGGNNVSLANAGKINALIGLNPGQPAAVS